MTDENARWCARLARLTERTNRARALLDKARHRLDHADMERLHAEAIAILEGRRDPRDGG